MYNFSVIAMNTKNGKEIYLGVNDSNGHYEWTFKRNEAIYFDRDDEAKNFANNHFTKFNGWFIVSLEQKL